MKRGILSQETLEQENLARATGRELWLSRACTQKGCRTSPMEGVDTMYSSEVQGSQLTGFLLAMCSKGGCTQLGLHSLKFTHSLQLL